MDQNKACKTCRWWVKGRFLLSPQEGECRADSAGRVTTSWYWCKQWRPKRGPLPFPSVRKK